MHKCMKQTKDENEREKMKVLRCFRKTARVGDCDVAWQTVPETTSCDREGTVADGRNP